MQREEFKIVSKEVLPHIKAIIETVQHHDVEGLVNLTVDKEGYFNFSIHSTDFSLYRSGKDDKIRIQQIEELPCDFGEDDKNE